MATLHDLTREVIAELDADGGGFRTREAGNLLFHRATEGLKLPKHVADLCRLGCSVAVTSHRPERAVAQRMETTSGQMDMAEVSSDFGHWVHDFAAMDETNDAVRKKLLRMTLPELRLVIAMRDRKVAEMSAMTRRLKAIIDDHPEWEASPETPLADILGVAE